MARRTYKIGSVGRYQARYGLSVRQQVKKIDTLLRTRYVCPRCGFKRVRRISTGIWRCRKCTYEFVGGAYEPVTPTGKELKRTFESQSK